MMTEDSFVDFKCANCGEPVSFPQSAVGFLADCPSCAQTLVITATGAAAVPLPIITSRLRLRRFTEGDADALSLLVSDEDRFVWVEGLPTNLESDLMQWLMGANQVQLTAPETVFPLAIELQDGARLIGFIGLSCKGGQRQATFNVSVHADFQRQKFGTEAVDALLGFCFEGIKLHRVFANCTSENTAARRLLESVGMRCEGEFVKNTPLPDGGWTNSVWFAALEEEYLSDSTSQ